MNPLNPRYNLKFALSNTTCHLIVLLVFVSLLLILGRGWLNYGFPVGVDQLSAPAHFWQIRNNLFNFGVLGGWNQCWVLGSLDSIGIGQIIGLLIMDHFILKVFFLANAALAGFLMYWFVLVLTKHKLASAISGIFYMVFPFNLLVMTDAGFITMAIAYTLTPVVFITIELYSRKLTVKNAFIAGLVFAALILTHRQIVILLGTLVVLYMLFLFVRKLIVDVPSHSETVVIAVKFLSPILIALFLSVYWWLPFFAEWGTMPGTQHSLTGVYSPSILGALTFWGRYELTNFWSMTLMIFPLALAFLAPVLARKEKNVLFFSLMGIVFLTLSMGTNSYIPLYEYAFKYIPFFDGVRTPARFLFAVGFSLAVLSGFTVKSFLTFFNKNKAISFMVPLFIGLLLFAGVCGESSNLFKTWDLNTAENDAMSWLADQEAGRIISLPVRTWAHSKERGAFVKGALEKHVNLWALTYLHYKESITSGIGYYGLTKYTEALLAVVMSQVREGVISSNDLIDILNVQYVVLDGYYTNPAISRKPLSEELFSNICGDLAENDKFEETFHSDNVWIFRNKGAFPRIFLLTSIDKTTTDLFEPSGDGWYVGEKTTTKATIDWSENNSLSGKSLHVAYDFVNSGKDYFTIVKNLKQGELADYDAFGFHFYLNNKPDNVEIVVNLFEESGGKHQYPSISEFHEGWNYVELPFSLFYPAYRADPNRRLDKNSIKTIWIGVAETGSYNQPQYFSLYFDNFTGVKYIYDFDNVSFEPIHPGKYHVNAKIEEPSYLILSESHHPQWVAKDFKTNEVIAKAEPLYIALNGFWLESGEYELIIEYEQSLPAKMGTIVSIVTLIAIMGYFIRSPIQKLLQRHARQSISKKRFKMMS